jgi:uncharacterized protein YdeI (YjbR/CyaY-like superfamily)
LANAAQDCGPEVLLNSRMSKTTELEIAAFASATVWRQWLAKHHQTSAGVWLQFFKKGADTASVTYAEALDEALCYGWIDGQLKSHDAQSWLRKFTPRRSKSVWSKKNLEHVARLTAAGQMKPAGRKAVEEAKASGGLKTAYDAPGKSEVPKDFLAALSKHPKAKAFFATLNRANVYAITWRLQTAKKPETRQKRMDAILAKLSKHEKFHE